MTKRIKLLIITLLIITVITIAVVFLTLCCCQSQSVEDKHTACLQSVIQYQINNSSVKSNKVVISTDSNLVSKDRIKKIVNSHSQLEISKDNLPVEHKFIYHGCKCSDDAELMYLTHQHRDISTIYQFYVKKRGASWVVKERRILKSKKDKK